MDTATKDGVHTWTFGNQIWQQTPDGRFSLRSIAGVDTGDCLVDLDYLAGARLAPGSSSQYLPAAFKFCPSSGEPLPAPAWNARSCWLPPYGDGSGSRVIADGQCAMAQKIVSGVFQRLQRSGARDLNDSKEIIELPRMNGLNFFVANVGGYRDALFALGREGSLFLWLRGAGKWQELHAESVPIGRTRLENWAWSVSLLAIDGTNALFLGGEEGAVLIKVDPVSLKYRTQRKEGRALAGPGDLEDRAWLPLVMSDGSVRLVSPTNTGWEHYPVADADPQRMTRLSAPVRDPSSRRLLWIGEHGYLSLRQGMAVQAQWHPWPDGATAYPEQGPPFRDGSGLWQQVSSDERLSYLQLDVGATDPSRPVKGYRLGTGHLSFKYNIRLERPWDEHDENLEPTTREVVYPFVEFTAERLLLSMRAQQSRPLDEFLQSEQKADVQYRLDQVGGIGFALKALVSEPWKAQWFFFDNAMWLYIDSSGALYRWKAE
ncbi:luciferase-type oxidoreductase, BA3436 family [Pseudomonas sp. StFLB209]|uniref:hypothetical protein n=1 Tax=Pseudomonas sp. StFLB209 TaxID=1028989 RepID=UPI0004F727EE|nr:hypothetical protein [Pseudomonas sp. StFLB209]BAP41338.1 luciferase-type oxidoreductase, BA3436 family [Pseudomonas sp. StFLB209]